MYNTPNSNNNNNTNQQNTLVHMAHTVSRKKICISEEKKATKVHSSYENDILYKLVGKV